MTQPHERASTDTTGSSEINQLLLEYAYWMAQPSCALRSDRVKASYAALCSSIAAVRECVRDAERYRWLRTPDHPLNQITFPRTAALPAGNKLDQAIDAAISAEHRGDKLAAHSQGEGDGG